MPKCSSCGHSNPPNPNSTGNERCEQCGVSLYGEPAPPADMSAEDSELLKLLQDGQKIAAVKLYRETHPGCGLKDAKEAVEAMAAEHGIERTKGSGCAGVMLLASAMIAGLWWW